MTDNQVTKLTGGMTKEDRVVPYERLIKALDYAALTNAVVTVYEPGEDPKDYHLLNKFDDGDGDFSYSLTERAVAVPASWIEPHSPAPEGW